ncbi:hypothetical protein [Nonomuraea sp. NPDC052265]|uniref:hypothetical protein n=1 Tax=Nonomuraea sp. NPDC052265 TaxID=3364374 RepID=UPI0037C6A1A8
MKITCSTPGIDHVHSPHHPTERFTVTYVSPRTLVGRIESSERVELAMLATLILCDPQSGPAEPVDVITEAEALEEMRADLEEGCDPETAPLREELASRLAHIANLAA